MTLNNNFTSPVQTPAPDGLQASGDFYDFKDSLLSRVTINLATAARQITRYTIQIRSVETNVPTPFNVTHLIKNGDTATDRKLEIDIIKSLTSELEENNIEYDFINLHTYRILHFIEIKELVLGVTKTYNLTYSQNFRYYATPVTLTDFTLTRVGSTDNHIQNGDSILISNLLLNHGANSPTDTTEPKTITLDSGITILPIVFTIQEDVLSLTSSNAPEYFYYERAYNPLGTYNLENIQLTNGKIYKVTANASWDLGYSTSKDSTQKLSILNRPNVAEVAIKSLYKDEAGEDDSIMDITIAPIVSGSSNLVSKIWFEFYNNSNVLVAKAGGANGIAVTSVNNQSTNNVHSLKLSNIAVVENGGLLNTNNYKVRALVKYTSSSDERRSASFPVDVNFAKAIPEIVGNTINSLYTIDDPSNGKILDIDVKKQAYELVAPDAASGIKFHFYDGNTLVASTKSYPFVNSSGTGNVSYPILRSEVTTGVLVNDKDYRIKAEVKIEKHDGSEELRLSELSAVSSPPDKVNFAKTIPEIVSNTINSLYTIADPSNGKILDIVVKKQAYQLVAPNATTGIKFHFYDGNTLVASTRSYPFVNNSETGNVSYPILRSEVTPGLLVNNTDYRIKAEVKIVKHDASEELRLSELSAATESIPDKVNFAKTIPKIVGNTINSLYTIEEPSNGKILDIIVEKQPYQLYAPNAATGIKFHFYDAADTTTIVASTNSYTFVNNSVTGNVSYPILRSEVTTGVLVNDKDYRIKAEVKIEKHDGSEELRLSELSAVSSPPDKVNFAKTIPEIVSNTINSLYTIADPSNGKILDIVVKKQAYQLVAPNATTGIKFHFYDGANLVASTSSYPFVNSSGTGNESYPILRSEVTPALGAAGAYLVNDKDYRIKAEVKIVKHDASEELRLSALSNASSPPDKVNFSLKRPVIDSITTYDLQNDGDMGNSAEQVIGAIVISKQLYELVAPTITNGIRFLIYASNESTLVATTASYTFQNSSNISFTEYNINIKLNEVTLEEGQTPLSNGTTYKVKAEVKLIQHNGSEELRSSAAFKVLKGSQDISPIASVSISNTWALATNNNPSSSSTRFNASPLIGISGYFKKTSQFNGGSTLNHLDIASTKFKIEYQVGGGSWSNVEKAVLLQKLSSESLQEAVSRVSVASVVSSGNGVYANVIGSGPGQNQEEMIFFIPQQQVTGSNAFTQSSQVKIRISIIDPTDMWQSANGGTTEPRDSNSIQLINKINNYNFVAGSTSEPFNTLNGSNLFLNIPVDWNSTHAHSVKVGVKYSSGDSYSYQTFDYPTSEVQINVNPATGTTLYYSVAYIVKNVNISSTDTTEGLAIEKSVVNKNFPVSSDYTITSTSYTTFNTGGKSSIIFNLAFNAAATSRIDGVNVYFTSPNTTQGSNIEKIRICSYSSSQGGNGKTIQLLHAGTTINYASSSDNDTLLNIMNTSGTIEASSSKKWGDYDLATISFEAYRDSRVESTNASYGTTYYKESGSRDFDKTIWNVPVLNAPSANNRAITLVGGVRNSNTATKLSWVQVKDLNLIPFTYDLTMKKNDVSSPLIHNDSGLNSLSSTNEKTLTIDTDNNAKYTITLASVFAPTTTGSMREVSVIDTITFHTIHVDVSNMNILVQHPSTTSIVSLKWNEPIITGESVTSSGYESATFTTNINQHYIKYSTTNPTTGLTRLASSSSDIIERIVSPATLKQFTLPVTSVKAKYSFFMHIGAVIRYKVNSTIKTTDSVDISEQTTTSDGSQYIVSSIPIITTFTNNIVSDQDYPTLSINLDANGLEDEGFISVLIILGQDGTQSKIDGEGVLLLFPDTGSNFNLSTSNLIGGSGAGDSDARLIGGEFYTSTPRNLHGGAATSLPVSTGAGDYVLTIGSVNSNTKKYNNSTLRMPVTSTSGFLNDDVNYMIAVTTRRGTNFAVGTFTYVPPAVVDNINITRTGQEYFVNFDLNTL